MNTPRGSRSVGRPGHPRRWAPSRRQAHWGLTLGVVVAASLLAGACGTSHSAAPPATTAPSPATTAPAATTPATAAPTTAAPSTSATTSVPVTTTTTPVTTTATLPPTGKGACSSGQLSVTMVSTAGAAGTFYYQFEARNVGAHACGIGGYFGVSLYDPAGKLITARDNRQPKSVSGAPAQPLRLVPRGIASFTISLVDATCRQSSPKIGAWHFIPPNDTTFNQVSTSFGYQYCGRGINVYPNELGAPKT